MMFVRNTISMGLLILFLAAMPRSASSNPRQTKAPPQKEFPEATLTIFPMAYTFTGPVEKYRQFVDGMMGPAGRAQYSEANITLGLLLEEEGYDKFQLTATDFQFSGEKAARKQRAASFGKFVNTQGLKTDYALCYEFTFHIEEGFEEMYLVIVDAKGAIVWEGSQGPSDLESGKDSGGTPQKCSELVLRRLTPVIGLDKLPNKELSADKRQQLRELRDSNPPEQPEFVAIEQRLQAMKKAAATTRVLIYPARISGKKVDAASATHLSELLNQAGLCRATVAKKGPVLEGEGWPNEAKVIWQFAHAARRYARQHPANADYVLFADYWPHPTNGAMHAIHFVVCDRAGEWVIVDKQNPYQEDFQRLKPKTPADSDRLVLQRLKAKLR